MISTFIVTNKDGAKKTVRCAIDPDRHTSVWVKQELRAICTALYGCNKPIVSFKFVGESVL